MSHRMLKGLMVSLVLLGGARAAHADFVLLKNAKNDTAQADREELKDYYTGKKKAWKNGVAVEVLLNAAGSAELKWLADLIVGASDDILLSKIKQEVFKGDMKKPATVSSADECIAAVKKTDGAVCVVDAGAAKALPAGVAILKVK